MIRERSWGVGTATNEWGRSFYNLDQGRSGYFGTGGTGDGDGKQVWSDLCVLALEFLYPWPFQVQLTGNCTLAKVPIVPLVF